MENWQWILILVFVLVVIIAAFIYLHKYEPESARRKIGSGLDINKPHILLLTTSRSYANLPKRFPNAKVWKLPSSVTTVTDIHEFAGNHSVASPFIIVAEGKHATTAIQYQQNYTLEVRGMVLIGPPHIDFQLPDNVIVHTKQVGLGEERKITHIVKSIDVDDIEDSIARIL
jgi:uncharacterized membrane protein